MKSVWAALLVALMPVACSAAASCPPSSPDEDWSAACFTGQRAVRQLKREYLARLKFDRSGHAVIVIERPRELVALDRRGVVVVPGIYHAGDFDYPHARAGLGRFRSGAKCGYFDSSNFQVRIPARFDHCEAFDESATVCADCVSYCLDGDCHERVMVGGQGYRLDQRNRVLERFTPPALAQACSGVPPDSVEHTPGNAVLRCPAALNSPFGTVP
ncbi:hypothetical protein [Duganella levis]|uniref:Lipoprotein n=1 Tax=Duganella levis TaxID=2692169 RepID=A0ABW9W7J9_9BURK|nr:hypothetical protein [Duganella levis]MYN29881.1 hypothetical protein [Duganella levis]